jgi:phosphoribosyl 1,2-cyclic phosphate phosphodiesterase
LRKGEEELLVDCGPDWRVQMEKLGKRNIGNVLITHAHFDHIGGLPELADLCRWTDVHPVLYAPEEVLTIIRRQFPWVEGRLVFSAVKPDMEVLGWTLTPFRVNHGKNGYSYAYRFQRDEKAWVYCPDSIALGETEKQHMRDLQLLILGTSFYKEEADFHTRSVYDMVEACALVEELEPEETLFTHMSHDIDMDHTPVLLPEGITLARTGQELFL